MPSAPQNGSTTLILTNDTRTLDAMWRDNSLWSVSTVSPQNDADAGEATVYWSRISTSGTPALADAGTIGGEDIATDAHTFFPSIAVNQDGDAAIGFSASASTIYAGSYFAERRSIHTADADQDVAMHLSDLIVPGVGYWFINSLSGQSVQVDGRRNSELTVSLTDDASVGRATLGRPVPKRIGTLHPTSGRKRRMERRGPFRPAPTDLTNMICSSRHRFRWVFSDSMPSLGNVFSDAFASGDTAMWN